MHVILSRRNLLTLLLKLDTPGSEHTIVKPGGIVVVAEPDEVHYANRPKGPGQMHPDTEARLREFEEALRIVRNRRAPRKCCCPVKEQ